MQRSYRLFARFVRLLTELKAGARTGVRGAAQNGSTAATNGIAKGATLHGGVVKDVANGGRTFWSHMPKAPPLTGAMSDAARLAEDTQQENGDTDWEGYSGLDGAEDMALGTSAHADLSGMRTDTPADLLLSILGDMEDGRQPDLRDVALARTVLLRHMDLYEPLNGGGHIRAADLEADVVGALMHQLGAGGGANQSADGPSSQAAPSPSSPSATDGNDAGGQAAMEEADVEGLRGMLALLMASRRTAGELGSASPEAGSDSDSDALRAAPSAVPPAVLDEVERALALVDNWQYDTFHLAEVTQGHALSCMGFFLLHREGLISHFRIHPTKLARLLRTVEAGYAANPYHNSTHAADVLQTLHVLLHGAGLHVNYLDHVGLLATYFAAIMHDHGHPGLTADFLIATNDPLAVRYNDRAPLENHHGASFFSMLQQPGMDALANLTPAEKTAFRKLVLDLVMATDMKQHFSLLSHFNSAHQLAPYNKDTGPWALALVPHPSRGGAADAGAGDVHQRLDSDVGRGASCSSMSAPRPLDETERVLSLQCALKAADLGHLGEELGVHMRWVRALEEEFFRQGDREAQLGLPISPLFDRAKQGVSKSQVGFFDFIALPLMHALASAFPGARPLLACYVHSYDHWRAEEKAAAAAAAAAAAELAPSTSGSAR